MKNDKTKTPILKTGPLPKQGGTYALVLQFQENITDILALQDTVINSLTADEKSFVLPKSQAFFEQHLSQGNTILGVMHNGQLIAQSIILNPTPENGKTGMVDMNLAASPEKVTVLQGVLVHPEYRGNKLMTVMVDTWLSLAAEENRIHAIAEVTTDNYHSWSVFLKEGLSIHSIGVDATDGTEVYNMHAHINALIEKRMQKDFNAASAKKPDALCPRDDIAQQKELIASGHKGTTYNPATDTFGFQKKKKCQPTAGP